MPAVVTYTLIVLHIHNFSQKHNMYCIFGEQRNKVVLLLLIALHNAGKVGCTDEEST